MGRKRAKDAAPQPDPSPVPTTRATVIDAAALPDDEAATSWLAGADLETLAADALARLNRVLHAHRVAAADPYGGELSLAHALVVRVGHGEGEQVADGRGSAAREGAPLDEKRRGRRNRTAALRPQERLAALLGGRDVALACEVLALRARSDLDADRFREAALQLRVAFEAALAELEPWRERPGFGARLDEL